MPKSVARVIRLSWEEWQSARRSKRVALEARGLAAPSRRTTSKPEARAALARILSPHAHSL
jgi:hypothetical protein